MKLCTIDGCEKPLLARGLCGMHYHRWERHGDPLGGWAFKGEAARYFDNVVATYEGSDCLIWPFARDDYGYGILEHLGEHKAHRAACRARNGPPPSADHEAAHSCGMGSSGCCNPNHLRWATRTENQRDRIEHGTSNRGSRHGLHKLTENDVLQIVELAGTASQAKIGKRFGVSQVTVQAVLSGKRWSWLTGIEAANDNDVKEEKVA